MPGGEHRKGAVATALMSRQGVPPVTGDHAQNQSTQLHRLKTQLLIHMTVALLWPKEKDADDPGKAFPEGDTRDPGSRCPLHSALHRQK